MEMGAVADLFDRNGEGLIDWQEFIAALRPDWQERKPATDADKIHDEVKRLVMLCTCRQKFRVFQVGEGKYRVSWHVADVWKIPKFNLFALSSQPVRRQPEAPPSPHPQKHRHGASRRRLGGAWRVPREERSVPRWVACFAENFKEFSVEN